MTLLSSRRNTLQSLRKRDLAEALKKLKSREEDLKAIDEELLTIKRRVASIQNQLCQTNKKKEILAGDLENEMILSNRLSKERGELKKSTGDLVQQKKEMSELVENLKDAAAMAKRALSAIEKKGK